MFVVLVTQFVVAWVRERRAKEGFRSALLSKALMAGGMSMIFVREIFRDVPLWIDAPLVILVSLVCLITFVLYLIKLKRYLKNAWTEQENK